MRALPATMTQVDQNDVISWLESGAPFAGSRQAGGGSVRRIDTHSASVFLAGDRAWKLKRPVRLGYLDFSTPEKRRAVLEAELRLNRRTAPALYLGLHRITREADSTLALDGTGEPIDWLLEMRRFPDGALLDERVASGEGLDDALVLALAGQIVALHASADAVRLPDGAARLRRVADGNAAVMAAFPALLEREKVEALTARIGERIGRHAALLDRRGREGCIAHVHGDLHLGNIALMDGCPLAFDRLEFDADLATIDRLYDLAFLLMDLWERGLAHQANMLFNRYLDLSGGDEDAVALLPLFMAVRASIRAHVLATRVDQGADDPVLARRARHYLDLALALLEQGPVRLVAIGGLSGTGKSTLARALGGEVGPAPGARILRSDVLRKRLAGVAPEQRLDAAAYSRSASHAVYVEIDRLARAALEDGLSVVADAVFAAPEERASIRAVAAATGCRFDGLWLMLGEAGRVARIERRSADASDADADVARAQTRRHPGVPEDWTILDAGGDRDALAVRARVALGLS